MKQFHDRNKIQHPGTLKNITYENIKELLDSGQIHPDEIYSANHFAEMLGVSRTPAREALLQLEAEGFLVAFKSRGFKIKEFTHKEISDFFEARKIIELHTVSKLVIELTKQDLKQLEDILKLMSRKAAENNAADFLEADKKFHMELIRHHGNLFLVRIAENIRSFISIFGQKAVSRKGRFEEVLHEHQLILDALVDRDQTKALEAINAHLDTTEGYLLEQV